MLLVQPRVLGELEPHVAIMRAHVECLAKAHRHLSRWRLRRRHQRHVDVELVVTYSEQPFASDVAEDALVPAARLARGGAVEQVVAVLLDHLVFPLQRPGRRQWPEAVDEQWQVDEVRERPHGELSGCSRGVWQAAAAAACGRRL